MYRCFWKQIIDFILSLLILIVLFPILLVVTLCLYFTNKGAGVFFLQERPGKNGKIFKVIKFKTMTDERDAEGKLLPDADRLTKIGKFIRSTSIDELPQLINVLKGDMALIGPRPLLPEYLPFYTTKQARRHEVRPGITGWAQVNGRNFLPFSKRFELDVWYVDNCTFKTDLKIILMSIKKVLLRKDISIGSNVSRDADDLGFTKYIKYTKE
ncbi:sugar transferase [Parabacteroides faecis]|uniref:Lipopolysaccharide/colanic/teichoic acid biosynthesis glycosyltransferase n=1 Tax=Parabacteroides faecis TaxID=1217282 RepID=A0ABR6KLI7_9BACT|nr:sugar transferase [Parabacteroides faecis]MBB4622341.1 lipopolysaccharide/colanic/teichoic acid biosynthesis glycosyltransferase [Parabacteroides faecis]